MPSEKVSFLLLLWLLGVECDLLIRGRPDEKYRDGSPEKGLTFESCEKHLCNRDTKRCVVISYSPREKVCFKYTRLSPPMNSWDWTLDSDYITKVKTHTPEEGFPILMQAMVKDKDEGSNILPHAQISEKKSPKKRKLPKTRLTSRRI